MQHDEENSHLHYNYSGETGWSEVCFRYMTLTLPSGTYPLQYDHQTPDTNHLHHLTTHSSRPLSVQQTCKMARSTRRVTVACLHVSLIMPKHLDLPRGEQ